MIKFYEEIKTGSIIASIDHNLSKEKYKKLIPNTKDASKEKHIPVYEIKDNKINIKVGSTDHPMEDNHYIAWIAQVNKDKIVKVDLYPGEKPEATFDYLKGAEIYAFCNLHGLWMTKVD